MKEGRDQEDVLCLGLKGDQGQEIEVLNQGGGIDRGLGIRGQDLGIEGRDQGLTIRGQGQEFVELTLVLESGDRGPGSMEAGHNRQEIKGLDLALERISHIQILKIGQNRKIKKVKRIAIFKEVPKHLGLSHQKRNLR